MPEAERYGPAHLSGFDRSNDWEENPCIVCKSTNSST